MIRFFEGKEVDVTDIELTGDVEKDFQTVVDVLRSSSYVELGEELEDIIDDPKLYNLLKLGFGDGKYGKAQMTSEAVPMDVAGLIPTQSEIGLPNSLAYALKSDCKYCFNDVVTVKAPIITFNDNFIIDGHHRWSQVFIVNPNARISAINFKYAKNRNPLVVLRMFRGAIAVADRSVPRSYAKVDNIYAMNEDEIRTYIDKNIQDVCVEGLSELVDGVTDRESAIDYLLEGCMMLKRDAIPYGDAPAREDMPQISDDALQLAIDGNTII